MSTMWIIWLVLAVCVTAIAFAWLFHAAGENTGDDVVKAWGEVMPKVTVASLAPLLIVAPGRGTFFRSLVLWAHHAAFLLLGIFLLLTLYSQFSAWRAVRQRTPNARLALIFRRLWIITELMPAPVALAILLTGLRLVWEVPAANSVSHLWLFLTVSLFGFFFWDGILGFRPIARELYVSWSNAGPGNARALGHRFQHIQLGLHVASYPFVFMIAASRWDPQTQFGGWIDGGLRSLSFLPVGTAEVLGVVVVWLMMGLLIATLRRFAL